MTDTPPIQEAFLDHLRREAVPVAVYLLSGIRLQGHIASHDQYCVALKGQTTQVILKRAISTITPQSEVALGANRREEPVPDIKPPEPKAEENPTAVRPSEVQAAEVKPEAKPAAAPGREAPARPAIRLKKPRRTE